MSYIVILMSFTAIFPSIGYGFTKYSMVQQMVVNLQLSEWENDIILFNICSIEWK
jgi:hypothetical protein